MSVQASSWAIEQQCATATEKAVLLVVASYAGPDGSCYPGQETIARQACCSVKTVERALASFEERGWILRKHRQRKDGSRTSDLIHLAQVANPEAFDQPDTVSVRPNPTRHPVQSNPTPCPIQPDTVSGPTTFEPLEEPLEEPSVERAPVRAAHADGFDRFWSAYPSKVGKRDAEKAFAKAVKRIDSPDPPGVMLAAIERAKQGRRWLEGYIPNPSTWLNQDRWEDQPDERPDHHRQRPTDARRADTDTRRNAWADVLAECDGVPAGPDAGGAPSPDGNGPRHLRLAHAG